LLKRDVIVDKRQNIVIIHRIGWHHITKRTSTV